MVPVTKLPVVIIAGPTASGKSALALQISQRFDGEIVCADSRTVYKGMNIGTAKPTAADQADIRHWGLDLVDPNVRYSAAEYQKMATEAIADIHGRGKLPVVVGGTGLYIDALLYGYEFGVAADSQLRAELNSLSKEQLLQRLEEVDPDAAKAIDRNNPRRLVRAIERAGHAPARHEVSRYDVYYAAIDPGVDELFTRIVQRDAEMLSAGLIAETEGLVKRFGAGIEALNTVPYAQVIEHLETGSSEQELCTQMDTKTRQLARRQRTWLRRNDDVVWFSDPAVAETAIAEWVEARKSAILSA